MLISKLCNNNFEVNWFKHNDTKYVLEYSSSTPSKRPIGKRTLTAPVDSRNMFSFWSTPGYQAFFSQASHYQPDWCAFPGDVHHIPSYESDEETEQLREPDSKPLSPTAKERYQNFNLPTPSSNTTASSNHIPFNDDDFEGAPPDPITADFNLSPELMSASVDPNVAMMRCKQHRLAVEHERFTHLSFSKMQLMARAGLIVSDLANFDPPTCPGCAYGKAHRRP
jgi:hypothetical protein